MDVVEGGAEINVFSVFFFLPNFIFYRLECKGGGGVKKKVFFGKYQKKKKKKFLSAQLFIKGWPYIRNTEQAV